MKELPSNYDVVCNELAVELYKNSSEVTTEYIELALNEVFKDNIASEIPVIKTLASIYKAGIAVSERFFVKKLLLFLNEYQKGTLSGEKKQKFIQDMSNVKYREKVTDTIMIFIDSFKEEAKSKIYANLFKSYISGILSWEKFINFSNCLDIMFLYDIEILAHFYKLHNEAIYDLGNNIEERKGTLNRLQYLGFLESNMLQSISLDKMKISGDNTAPIRISYFISDDGVLFYQSISHK